MRRTVLIPALAAWILAGPVLAADTFLADFDLPPDATYVGSVSCVDCHDDVAGALGHSAHSVDLDLGGPGTPGRGCEACHGPASLHVAADGDGFILGADLLGNLTDTGRVTMCTQCHQALGHAWNGGPHQGADVTCADCHADQVHFAGRARPAAEFRNPSEFCLQCHADQAAAFRLPFRHRALEGQVVCGDCHDPHRGFDQLGWNGLNDVCLGCHTEMAGPFVFEHEGVAGENCTACHLPHGSNHDKLLSQEGNGLCLQCHYGSGFNDADGFTIGGVAHNEAVSNCTACHPGGPPSATGHTLLNYEGRCIDCHMDVHGSNVAPGFTNR